MFNAIEIRELGTVSQNNGVPISNLVIILTGRDISIRGRLEDSVSEFI